MTPATWWYQATPGTTYWRCKVPADAMGGKLADFSVRSLKRPTVPAIDDEFNITSRVDQDDFVFPEQEGVAIWQFPGSAARMFAMHGMRIKRIPTLVEVDDNYLIPSPPSQSGFRRQWSWRMNGSLVDPSHEIHREIVKSHADAVICSTPSLAQEYRRFTDKVFVGPNSIDPTDWPTDPPVYDGDVLRIGWAASGSHFHDAPLVRNALDWASRQDGVEVVQIGHNFWATTQDSSLWQSEYDEHGEWTGRYVMEQVALFDHQAIPWTDDLQDYRKSLPILDVGLCPLVENNWSRHKSDVKALEYAMAGALPIVGRTEPYRPWWDRTLTVDTTKPKDWLKMVKWIVAHRDEVADRARRAREYVLEERTIAGNTWRWQEAIDASR